MDREAALEFERWTLETRLVEDLLTRIEEAERAILDGIFPPGSDGATEPESGTWRRHCRVEPQELKSLAWMPDDLTLPPPDAEHSQVSRVFVHTSIGHDDPRYIYITVEGVAQKRRPSAPSPYDPVTLYAILKGEQPAPWPKRTAARERRRSWHAMMTLLWVGKTRLALEGENPRIAAHAALYAGLYANDAAVNAALAENPRKGGRLRGAQIAENARATDARIELWSRRWQKSDIAKEQYPSLLAYLKEQIPSVSEKTIRRRLTAMGLSQPRQTKKTSQTKRQSRQ
jgi:hypothetical protein